MRMKLARSRCTDTAAICADQYDASGALWFMGADTDRLAPAGVIPVTEWFRTIIRNFPPTAAAHPDARVRSMPMHTEKLQNRIHRDRCGG
jgi:hypothetical protein